MRILVCGAGVIGTLYAAKLRKSGHLVTVLARGRRLADIRTRGLQLEDLLSGRRSTVKIATIEHLSPEDQYEVALITVRRDQLAAVMPMLEANRSIPTLLFMLNNPIGSDGLALTLGHERVLLGFPGAGGALDGWVVRYALISQQPTTLGELTGLRSERLRVLTDVFRAAGFPTTMSGKMDDWLKTHAFFVTAVTGAIYLAGGDCRCLSEDKATLKLMNSGVRQRFAALRALRVTVTPFPLRLLFVWLPPWFAYRYWRKFFATDKADFVFGRHARSASEEMRQVAADCLALLQTSGVEAPALRHLYRAIDAYPASRPF